MQVVGEAVAIPQGVGDAEATAVGVVFPRRDAAERIGHARQQSLAGLVGMVGIFHDWGGPARRGHGRSLRHQTAPDIDIGPRAAREIAHCGDAQRRDGCVGERQPAAGILEVADLRDPAGARNGVDPNAVAETVLHPHERADGADRLAKHNTVALEVGPREANGSRSSKRAENPVGIGKPSRRLREVEPRAHVGKPGRRSVGHDFDPVAVGKRPAFAHTAVAPRSRRPRQPRNGVG